jgi:RNA polymerase sigma-70 factor (ECF subfamily)
MTLSQSVRKNALISVEFNPIRHTEKELKAALGVSELDDSALLARIAQKDEAALGALYDRYGRLVFSIAFGVVQNRETAEEITLDIFTTIWEKAHTYDPTLANTRTWLARMARNKGIDRLRREKVRPSHHSIGWAEMPTEPAAENMTPETAVHQQMEQQRVRAAIASLPKEQQEALSLAYFQGYSHSQIAQVLNQPLGTVKGRIRGAMQKLRQLLAEEPS